MTRPVKKFKAGRIEAAIWENEKEMNDTIVGYKTVSVKKSWKDKENVWRDATIQLRRNELATMILVLQKAQEELLLQHEEGDDNE